MEILLLLVYAFFIWLIFIKFKLLPWNITSQAIVIVIPIVALSILFLCLNIMAPASSDVRVINYVVQVVPRVTGRVIEVPVEPNRPVKKGDVLFRIDPIPFQLDLKAAEADLARLRVQLVTAQANTRGMQEQLKTATGKKEATEAKLALARRRSDQFKELAQSGAGTTFDLEQAQADVRNLEGELASLAASEAQVREKLSAQTPEGEQDEIAAAKAQIAEAEARRANAQWSLDQTVFYAPADGRVVNLQLRPGSYAAQLPMVPVMSFVEDEQWLVALFKQNELHQVAEGNEAEVALRMYPGQIIKCKVDSVIWATGQGQLPLSGTIPQMGPQPMPEGSIAVRLSQEGKGEPLFLGAGARGSCAIYTDTGKPIQILRKVLIRVSAKLDWVVVKHLSGGGHH
jgi:multidrug resistance efflux pump